MSEVPDLRVVDDSALRFMSHVARIINTSPRTLGVACRETWNFQTPVALLTTYRAITIPYLEYGSAV